MNTLTIDRGQWLTGTAHKLVSQSGLCQTKQHLMCCLGFLGCALGYTQESMRDSAILTEFEQRMGVLTPTRWLRHTLDATDIRRFIKNAKTSTGMQASSYSVEDALTAVNDRLTGIANVRRESAIAYLFKKYGGIAVTFTGKYAEGTKRARLVVEPWR